MGDGVFGAVVDTGTGQQRVLCSLPGCDHTGPDCEGWMCSAGPLGEQAADTWCPPVRRRHFALAGL